MFGRIGSFVCWLMTSNTEALSGAVPRSMAHMVALEVGLPTTRELEPMLAGALSMGHTDHAGLRKVGIHAQKPMRKPVRDPMYMEIGSSYFQRGGGFSRG